MMPLKSHRRRKVDNLEIDGRFYKFPNGPWIDRNAGRGKALTHLLAHPRQDVGIAELVEEAGWSNTQTRQMSYLRDMVNAWSNIHRITDSGRGEERTYRLSRK